VLHGFQTGAVQSKRSSVLWAAQSLETEWRELIAQAWEERKGVRFGAKIRQPAKVELLQETARFITYAQNVLSSHRPKTG